MTESIKYTTKAEVADVMGFVSEEFGEPVFRISTIILKNGKELWVDNKDGSTYVPLKGFNVDLDLWKAN